MALRVDILPATLGPLAGQGAVRGDCFEDTYLVKHVLRSAGLVWRKELKAWTGDPQLCITVVSQLSKVPAGSKCAWEDGAVVLVTDEQDALASGARPPKSPTKLSRKPNQRPRVLSDFTGETGPIQTWYPASGAAPRPSHQIGSAKWVNNDEDMPMACVLVGYERARHYDALECMQMGIEGTDGYWGQAWYRRATWPEFHALMRTDPHGLARTPEGPDPEAVQLLPQAPTLQQRLKGPPVLTDMPDADDLFGKL